MSNWPFGFASAAATASRRRGRCGAGGGLSFRASSVWREQHHEILAHPLVGRSFSHDGPDNQRATQTADRSREAGRVTGSELTDSDGFVEQRSVSGIQTPRVLDGKSVEIRIADIEL